VGHRQVAQDVFVVVEPHPELGDRFARVVDVLVGERERDAVEEWEEDQQQHDDQGGHGVGIGLPVFDQVVTDARGTAEADERKEDE